MVQIALANVSVNQAYIRNSVLVEDPARPSFIHRGDPALIEPDAWQPDLESGPGRNSSSRMYLDREFVRKCFQLRIDAVLLWNIDRSGIRARAGEPVGLDVFGEERKQRIKAAVGVIRNQVAVAVRRLLKMPGAWLRHVHLGARDCDLALHWNGGHTEQQRKRLRRDIVWPLKRTARIFRDVGVVLNFEQRLRKTAVRLRQFDEIAAT